MKTLTLMRHAKSDWGQLGDDPRLPDAERPLNAKGRRAASAVGRHLRAQGVAFDRLVASPAVRVRETLDALAAGFGPVPEPAWDRRLYLASADALADVVRGLPDEADRVLLLGHNPGLEDLVLLLVPPGAPSRELVESKYPTATVAELALAADRWADVGEGGARLTRFVRPRDLDPTLGPDAD